MFQPKDVAEYYNTTQVHYEKWWDLNKSHSLHYGIWDEFTKNFRDAVSNTNKILLELADTQANDRVLDAGCGVGGTVIFLCERKNVRATGITLSKKQVDFANTLAHNRGLSNKADFQVMDYTQTSFPNESFDVIWACESICHAPDKSKFIKEAHRLLKKGGKLILIDFFLTKENQIDPNNWIKKWGETWAISNFSSAQSFVEDLDNIGFSKTRVYDYTSSIQRSAKRLYYASVLGSIPSKLYNIVNPNVSRFAKNHYKCGIYQYKALKKKLWEYKIVVSVKNT